MLLIRGLIVAVAGVLAVVPRRSIILLGWCVAVFARGTLLGFLNALIRAEAVHISGLLRRPGLLHPAVHMLLRRGAAVCAALIDGVLLLRGAGVPAVLGRLLGPLIGILALIGTGILPRPGSLHGEGGSLGRNGAQG